MKAALSLAAVLATLTSTAFAELDIPRSVFRVDQLEEAKAKALEDEEPLIFVYTDPGTS